MVAIFITKIRHVLSLQMAAFYTGKVYEQQYGRKVQAHQEASFAEHTHCLFLSCTFLRAGLGGGI